MPKPAWPVLDVPLGGYGLIDLRRIGVPIFVNLGSGHEIVRTAFEQAGGDVHYIRELPEPYGSAGTLRALRHRFKGPVVTRNADALTDASVVDAIEAHMAAGALATLVTVTVKEKADLVAEEGRAVRFIDRRVESIPGEQWIGISVFERDALDLIDDRLPLDLAMGLVAPLIERGEVAILRHDGYFLDVGTIARYLRANDDLLYGRVDLEPTPPGRIVEVDGGPAYIGPGADVEETSLGAGAVIMSGAKVAATATVERAVVWPDEQVPPGTSLRDGVWAFGNLER